MKVTLLNIVISYFVVVSIFQLHSSIYKVNKLTTQASFVVINRTGVYFL